MKPQPNHYRPSWDDYFMAIARLIATRSTCDRLSAGTVLVKDKRIISTGYNGSPPGLPHCDDAGHLLEEGHCVRTIHGEHNAILQAATQGGTTTRGSTMYTKYVPCIHCCKYVVAAGVTRVVYVKIYRNTQALDYLEAAGLKVDQYVENPAWKTALINVFTQEVPTQNAPEVKFTVEPPQQSV